MKAKTKNQQLSVCKAVCFNKRKIDSLRKRLPSPEYLQATALRHKAMGHPVRQAILSVLEHEECCVCDLANILGQPVSTISQHLHALKSVELLCSNRVGKLVFFSVNREE